MSISLIDNVIKRFQNLFPEDVGISSQELNKIEKKLDILFPEDFKKISKYYSGGLIGGQSIFTFSADETDDYSLVFKNLVYRKKIGLTYQYIVLYDEYGFLLLNTKPINNKLFHVIDIATTDIFNLIEENSLESEYKIYNSFTDFFEYLLDQEEEERREGKKDGS